MSDYICQELIVEIFTRLPTKSLLRFRSVSKSLCSCIDSRCFIRLHTLRSPQKLLIVHRDPRKIQGYIEYFYTLHSEDQLPLCSYVGGTPAVSLLKSFFNVGSCNGIICMSSFKIVTLWNPSVRRKLTIPCYPNYPSDPCCFALGFGFDPIIDDYKFVSLVHKQPRGVHSSFVYTIKTCTWSEIASPTTTTLVFFIATVGCFVNGTLHWVVKYYINDTDEIGHLCIKTFDLSSHVFDTIELHDPTWIDTTLFKLMNINGSLALVCSDGRNSWIWVRRRDYNDNNNTFSWHVDFKLKQDSIYGLRRVLQFTTHGDLLLDIPYEEFQSHNPQTMVRSTLAEFNDSSHKVGMEMCVESLELLDIGTPYDEDSPPSSSSSSCGAKKIRSRTTLEKLSDSCILCSTTLLRKICNVFSNGVHL